jgi:hypothetical protein
MIASRNLLMCLVLGCVLQSVWTVPAAAQVSSPLGVSTGPERMVPSDAPNAANSMPLLSQPGINTRPGVIGYGMTDPSLNGNAAGPASPTTAGPQYPGSPYLGSPNPGSPYPGATFGSPPLLNRNPNIGLPFGDGNVWNWQVLPEGLLYKSYLAGPKESRMGTELSYTRGHGWFWDATLGARIGLLRYGTEDSLWPEGWQWDVEGAAFPRLDLASDRDLHSVDFRAGTVLTHRNGPWEWKFGYYHLSSHMGDEYLLQSIGNADPSQPIGSLQTDRINYVRDSLIYGFALRPHPDWRFYAEVGWAFNTDGGARPWEFQVGGEYSPAAPTGIAGTPFVAANGHLRQDNDFSGNFVLEAGWQWRGRSGHLARFGGYYFNGMSEQYQFFDRFEDQVGLGLWYDF